MQLVHLAAPVLFAGILALGTVLFTRIVDRAERETPWAPRGLPPAEARASAAASWNRARAPSPRSADAAARRFVE